MPKTEDTRAAHTKQALRDAMLSLLQSHDFEIITSNEICRAAGISRSTFYIHYEDKYDLMVDCLNHLSFSPRRLTTDENLEAYFVQVLITFRQRHKMYERLLRINDTMELKHKVDHAFWEEYFQYFNNKYPNGTLSGVTIEMLATYHCHGIMAMILRWHEQGYPTPINTLAAFFADQIRKA